MRNDLLRGLPKLDVLLAFPTLSDMEQRFPHALVKEAAQSYIDALRAGLISGSYTAVPAIGDIAGAVVRKLETGDIFALKRVINATGVVLHTNLGRAPLGRKLRSISPVWPQATAIWSMTLARASGAAATTMLKSFCAS